MLAFFALFFLLAGPQTPAPIVPAGTQIQARLESAIRTDSNSEGDLITARVAEAIRTEGKIIVPRGSRLNGRVETIEAASTTSEGRVRLVFREIHFPDGRTASTWITNSFSAKAPNQKLRYLLYMGIGGAAGAFIGGETARVAGLLGGTLIGFVIAGNSTDGKLRDLKLKAGRVLRLQLQEDLRVE